ncbi:MAG: hypothetical protein UW04_C0013G0001, partial [Parcubacteria group bacterium GW2011_GWB1_43_8]
RFKTKIVGLTIAALMSAGSLIPMVSSAVTIDELLAQIAALQAQLLTLQGSSATVSADKCSFTRSLTVGSRGDDVTCLQNYLKTGGHLSVNATGYFGSLTKAAAASWQAANGVAPAVGYFGSISRAKYDSLTTTAAASSASSVASSAASSASSVVATGEGLTITSATQPAATLAVGSAARLPFTKVTLTAGAQDVTVTGITVERTGLAVDTNFAGVVLLDDTGTQLGISKTLNSDHKATVGDTVTIKAGQSKTFTIAGNMAASGSLSAGQVAYLSVTGVTTSATVSGLLPISGAGHTINTSLSIGGVTNAVGSTDPQTSPTKPVGTTGYTFSSVKFTATSAEKIKVSSIRWNQSGSVGTADLANIKTYIDGTAYDTVVSSDGKYYTSTFGTSGIIVDKGGFVEMSVKGDIVGGSGRTIDFDVYKNTDLNITGETYGYGVTPPLGSSDPTDDTSAFSSTNPWYDASQVTVSAGTITVTKATSVASQNVAVNVANQPLGGFVVETKGEPISANNLIFRFQLTGTGGQANDITNISLYDENGAVVAGPADGATAAAYGTVTFSDTITFPIGTKSYTLKGKLGTDFTNNQTIVASTTPSADWSNVIGQTTGNSISGTSITSAVVSGNTMTVKSAALTISVSTSPVAQTVVSGAQGFTFANYLLDASASGEDLKMSTVPLAYETYGGTATNVNNCILYDDSTALNSGSNVVNPSTTGSSTSVTLDTALTITKGTVKTLTMKCNIVASATGNYAWGYDSGATPTITGVTSGQSVTPTENDSTGQRMTLSTGGTLTVASDSASTPSYTVVAAGGTATLGVIKFTAANEAISLSKLGLKITNTASSSVSDLTEVTLWSGSTQVGSLTLTGNTGTSTIGSCSGCGSFVIDKDGDKLMTVKGTLAAVGTSQAGTQGALIAVDYIGAGNAEGTGSSSGSTISSSSGATAFAGVRMFKSYPTLAKLTAGSTKVASGNLSLYRFKVTASSGGSIGIYKFTVQIATSSATAGFKVDNINILGFSDSGFSTAINGVGTDGRLLNTAIDTDAAGKWTAASTDLEIYPQSTGSTASTTIQIGAGESRYFDVKADVTTVGTTYSISTQVQGDAAYGALGSLMDKTINIETEGGSNNDFIWSPNATTTSLISHQDWTNGYGVSGLPSSNMTAEILTQ